MIWCRVEAITVSSSSTKRNSDLVVGGSSSVEGAEIHVGMGLEDSARQTPGANLPGSPAVVVLRGSGGKAGFAEIHLLVQE